MDREDGLIVGEDGRKRCFWHGGTDDYRAYHDHEWGRPVVDDSRQFRRFALMRAEPGRRSSRGTV